jgi:hypothetical protein
MHRLGGGNMRKPDLYLKVILTVIAFALIGIGLTLNTKPVQAQTASRVVISGIDIPTSINVLPVGIAYTARSQASWYDAPLPVQVANTTAVPVQVSNKVLSVAVENTEPAKKPQ